MYLNGVIPYDITLVHICAGGEACPQGMAGEQFQALGLWQVGAADTLEQGAKVNLGIVHVLLQRVKRAGLVTGAATNLNLAPAGFACECQEETLILDCNPTFAVLGIVAAQIKANNFRGLQAPPAYAATPLKLLFMK